MTSSAGFTEDDLSGLAGPRSFERGLGYRDAVAELDVGAQRFTAVVSGTEAYEVVLELDEEYGLSGECDCPYGLDGNFCKHCVAVGLVVLEKRDELPRLKAEAKARAGSLESWLGSRSRDDLVLLVRELMDSDRSLRRRLELRAATAQADPAQLRARIADLLAVGRFSRYGYVEYADAQVYALQAGEAVAAVRALTAEGQAAQAVALAREAIRLLGRSYDRIDDSAGCVGGVAADLDEAHLEACRAAAPDRTELADWLVDRLLGDHDHLLEAELGDYRDLLGEPGLRRVRERAEEASRRNPSGWAEKHLMKQLAKAERGLKPPVGKGDRGAVLPAQVARDGAGRPDEALAVYRRAIEGLKPLTGDARYREMARLLLEARACHRALGTEEEFAEDLAALKADQRRKRNLLRILDEHGL
ncbi:SWIM zinc finger domain-containing protein [Kitasatospora sp. NPDC091207]|uniref:SWIM zinc finger family protein n=1 Tax=Kitasatospora sp. NPDC091207 TaxID=3364083 RepID=UPI00382C2F56